MWPICRILPLSLDGGFQFLDFFHCNADRLFAQHVLSRGKRLQRSWNMKGIGNGDDDRLNVRIGEHLVVVEIDVVRVVEPAKAIGEPFVRIANRLQHRIARLLDRLKMRELRDGPAPQNSDA